MQITQLPKSIPIFPLNGALLLPEGNLPLNIFEPRYISMIDYAMKNEKMIGMIQENLNSLETNNLYSTGCLGKINQYNETDENFVEALTDEVGNLPGWPNYYILAPYHDMEHKISLSAWGVLAYLDDIDSNLMNDFAKAYRGQGPESGAPPCQPSTMLE